MPKIVQVLEAGTGSKSRSGSKARVFPPHGASPVLLTVMSAWGSSPPPEGTGSPDKVGSLGLSQDGGQKQVRSL